MRDMRACPRNDGCLAFESCSRVDAFFNDAPTPTAPNA